MILIRLASTRTITAVGSPPSSSPTSLVRTGAGSIVLINSTHSSAERSACFLYRRSESPNRLPHPGQSHAGSFSGSCSRQGRLHRAGHADRVPRRVPHRGSAEPSRRNRLGSAAGGGAPQRLPRLCHPRRPKNVIDYAGLLDAFREAALLMARTARQDRLELRERGFSD